LSDWFDLGADPPPAEKPRRAKPNQSEHGLSRWVDDFFDRAMQGNCWYTSVETGTWMPGASREARMIAETRRRARGIKPAHLDWYAWQESTGKYTQFELKVEGRPTRLGQDQTIAALRRNNIPTSVCETVLEVCDLLLGAGFVLHGNARNIAAELHERHLAQRRAEKPKKPRAHKSQPRFTAGKRLARKMFAG